MRRRSETVAALLFAGPWIIGFTVFLVYPLAASIYYSFCDYSVLKPPMFVGTANYADLARDRLFWQALGNTLWYSAVAIPLVIVVALALALLLNTRIRGLAFYRTCFFIPSLVPQVALAVLWLWIFNGEHGLVNHALRAAHLPGPAWLSDPAWSKPALVLLSVWGCGNAMVIYLAGLQDVPATLYEASVLDGAGWWSKTWNVTMPMLSPVILFNAIMAIIGTLQVFAVPYIMFPGGAPARSTYFYAMYLFDNAFIYHKMGYACAMAWILFLVIFALTSAALLLSRRRVYYGGA